MLQVCGNLSYVPFLSEERRSLNIHYFAIRLLGFLHKIADGYAKIPPGSGPKETFKKINVLKQSLRKVNLR